MVRSIVDRYGGTVAVDIETNTVTIDVPKDKEQACAKEVQEKVGNLLI